jgi:restriction system protein
MLVEDNRLELNPTFFGRQKELEWLFNRYRGRRTPIVISGAPGVGKTTLLKQFLASARARRPPLIWTLRSHPNEAMVELSARIAELYQEKNPPEIVAIDEAEVLAEREMNDVTDRLLNLKAIRTVIFATRRRPDLSRAEILELGLFTNTDAEEILKRLLGDALPEDAVAKAVATAGGLPLALSLLSKLLRGQDPQQIGQLLKGEIYNLKQGLILPSKELIAEIKPRIILANETLVERLRRQPQSVYELPPRKFEELVAELLADLGYVVELTPASRDGGKDILAYMSTPHGRVLCLVEAKRYRQDRPVGVELVRQLYGTLIDADASSAMLVTTSSFSSGARAFQQKHQYKLALRDYGNIVQWIQDYGKK